MWYEIIPAALVVMAGVVIPQHAARFIFQRCTNNVVHRKNLEDWIEISDIHYYTRDHMFATNIFAAGDDGLNAVPDD